MTKTFPIVMLPTEKAIKRGDLILASIEDKPTLHFASEVANEIAIETGKIKGQHLYIVSDEEIKEGDWAICGNEIFQSKTDEHKGIFKKIVATTDKSLTFLLDPHKDQYGDLRYNKFQELPKLPESFIQTYIKGYNEGKSITEVDLEMQYMALDNSWDTIKTTPDNTVIIKEYR